VVDKGDRDSGANRLDSDAVGNHDVTAKRLHQQARFHQGRDLLQKPYTLFRTHIGALPVLLRRRARLSPGGATLSASSRTRAARRPGPV
jgi:hypothetical protein